MDSENKPIQIETIAQKWRFECPNGDVGEGHTNWFPIDGVFRCHGCSDLRVHDPTIEPEYEFLRDKKTGRLVSREELELKIERGPAKAGT